MEKPVKLQMLGKLQDLGEKELKTFKWFLENKKLLGGFEAIKKCHLEKSDRTDIVDLMVQRYTTENAMKVMSLIFRKMEERESDIVSRKEQPRSSDPAPKAETAHRDVQDDNIYPVTEESISNRVALIINNINFTFSSSRYLGSRRGAEKDEEAMQNLLTKFGYEVAKHRDVTAKGIDDALIQFSKHPKLLHTDSVFVVVMSHGEMGVFYGSDSNAYLIDKLYLILSSTFCPALVNKPKIILIQTCSGAESGSVILPDELQSPPEDVASIESDSPMFTRKDDMVKDSLLIVHKEKDFIAVLASTKNTVSYRSVEHGSFFIRYIVNVFNTSYLEDDIEELFRKVMKCFEVTLSHGKLQMPTKDRCTLTKKFYLFPGNTLQVVPKKLSTDGPSSSTPGPFCQHKLKSNLKKMFQGLFEGIAKAGNPTLLNDIYTKLYITEGGTGEVNEEHEVREIETGCHTGVKAEKQISCGKIFKLPIGRDELIRTVMTKGVAGIGKTVLTRKFTLDWAEEKSNQDIQFLFPFTFKHLNAIMKEEYSLMKLVHENFSETKEIGNFEEFQVVFIFDGLDECRPPLDFDNTKIISDPTESASVRVLLTNLIRGKLLPSARLWITTRPAAANQIPSDCIHLVTEVRGFTDPQKEEYFRKKFRDEQQSSRIISHIETSRSLHIMCHIPVFCWITATVLKRMMETREERYLPKTLTEMYIQFLVVQAKVKKVKYDGGTETDPHWSPESKKMIESLGKLAFEQLQKGNMIFYEEDLTECGIDIREASVYSGVFTEVFREESGLYQDKVFCFVHLSIQEFLAALHVHLTFINSVVNLLEDEQLTSSQNPEPRKETHFYQTSVDKALQSPNGHLDLFLRFLLGLSLHTNQKFLRGLLTPKGSSSQTSQETIQYIQKKISENLSAEKSINLFHCLNELNDRSLVEEIQQYLSSGSLSTDQLSPGQWSALVFILLSSGKDLELFDLKKYSASEEALLRLLPVVKASKKAILSGCNLSERSCKSLSSLLISKSSSLTELDLGNNQLMDSGVIHLCARLEHSPSKLEIFRLNICHLSGRSCESLSSLLSSESSILTELDLSNNDLQDSGVRLLSVGMESPHCKLETLRLSGCLITEEGCTSLVSALRSNPSHLRQLDLSYNHPGKSAVKHFITALEDPNWRLETLRVEPAGEKWLKPGLRKYSTELTINTSTVNKNIKLSNNSRRMTFVEKVQSYPDHPDRFDEDCRQLLCKDHLPDRCYWEAEWTGNASLSVSYRGISRRGDKQDCVFGRNDQSWSLDCYDRGMYIVCHNDNQKLFSSSITDRIAVYLDCAAGTLTYYKIISGARLHIHTFSTTFTEPLYAGFRVWPNSSVTLC